MVAERLKSGKAKRCDGIPAELLKTLGERRKKYLVEVFYETEKWLDDYTKATSYNREEDERFRMSRP